MEIRPSVRIAALAAAVAMGAAACGGGGGGEQQAAQKGGTLFILEEADFEHLDPARAYVTNAGDFGGRLLTRSLTQYKAAPGKKGLEIAPDLAVGLGKPNEDKTVWTFTLKDGLKYEDGSPITSQDIKYGVERTFSADLPEGPPWARVLLEGGDKYEGPYKDKGGLDSIETPDDKTIVFNLNRAVPDFNYATTFALFGPVPEAKDTGVNYDNHPFSSGPYKIQSYDRDKELVLVRNKNWDPKTDPVRKARPDRIVVKMGIKGSVIDQRLIASQGDDANAITLGDVTGASIAKIVNDPKVKERLVQDVSGCTRFLAINTTNKPLDNVKVRQAINYATSQVAYQTARGGPFIGDISSTILPPTIAGYKEYNAYPNNDGKGDPEKAKQLLADAGFPDGLELTLTSTSDEGAYGPDPSAAIQESLAKAGIKVKINAVSTSVYYTEIGDIKKESDLVYYGWCPDWPSAATYIPPILDGRNITPQGNTVVSQLNADDVNQRIDEIMKMTDLQQANQAWGDLDEMIMQKYAPMVPLMADNRSSVVGENVTGAYPHQAWSSLIDLATVSVGQQEG